MSIGSKKHQIGRASRGFLIWADGFGSRPAATMPGPKHPQVDSSGSPKTPSHGVPTSIAAVSALALVCLLVLPNCSSDSSILAPYIPRPHMRDTYPAYNSADGSIYYSYTTASKDTVNELRYLSLASGGLESAGTGTFVSFSADGTRRATWNGGALVLTDVTADSTILVLSDGRYGRATWSPSGEQIAVDVFLSGATDGVWVMDLASGNRTRVLGPGARWPAWSPSGDKLAFTLNNPDAEIAILELATGQIDTVTDNDDHDTQPAFSSDGAMLAWSRTSSDNAPPRLVVRHTDTTSEVILNVHATSPAWTFDTPPRVICSYWEATSATFKLAVVHSDGSGLQLLAP